MKYTQETKEIGNQLEVNSSNISVESLCDIRLLKAESPNKYTITLEINEKTVKMEFDTGAAHSSISLKQYEELKFGNSIYKTEISKTYTNEILIPSEVIYVKCKFLTAKLLMENYK